MHSSPPAHTYIFNFIRSVFNFMFRNMLAQIIFMAIRGLHKSQNVTDIVRHQSFVLEVDWCAYFAIEIQLQTEIFCSFLFITQPGFTLQLLYLAWECFMHAVIYLIPNSNPGIIFPPFEIHCFWKKLQVRILLL